MRLRQGVILLIGAIVIMLAIGSSSPGFYWTPLALGVVYLAGALSGVLRDARFSAMLLGAVGLVSVLLGAFAREGLSERTAGPLAR
ncbi:MAG: hypothetical protein ACRDPM_18625 [Solirubrobacteraceae bacterium]